MDERYLLADFPVNDIIDGLKITRDLEDVEEKLRIYSKGFRDLGDWYVKESDFFNAETLRKHRMRLKAVCLYNLALASGGNQSRIIEKIKNIEESVIQTINGKFHIQSTDEYYQEILYYKTKLKKIRAKAEEKLASIDIASIDVKYVYQDIAISLKKLVKKIIEKCFEMMPPPKDCQYSIIVLGSLAREEATPYSDLEWSILIGEDNDQHKEYFRRLTEVVWIKILNLQETTPRIMDIKELDWFFESVSPCKKGFSFDGQMLSGCHTPLGNRHHDVTKEQQYELIGTPKKLAQFQFPEWENKRGFCTVLSSVASICSNEDGHLLEKYLRKMRRIWSSQNQSNLVGTAKTQNLVSLLPIPNLIQTRSLKYLSESLERFKFKGGRFDAETHFFDVKYHLYRQPTMWIDHLASYFSIESINIWDKVQDIFIKKFANVDGGNNINKIVSKILAIRLKTYLNKGYREDHVIMIDRDAPEKNEKILEKYFCVKIEVLFGIFTVLIQLHSKLLECVDQPNEMKNILLSTIYPEADKHLVCYIYETLCNYRKAIEINKENLENATETEKSGTLFPLMHYQLGLSYSAIGDYINALQMLNLSLGLFAKLKTSKEIQLTCIDICFSIGRIYHLQLKPQAAMKKLLETVSLYSLVFGQNAVEVEKHWGRVGKTFVSFKLYSDAIILLQKSIQKLEHSSEDVSIFLAEMFVSLGRAYRFLSNYKNSMIAYERAMELYSIKFGNNCIYNGMIKIELGEYYFQKREFCNAIRVVEESKLIFIDDAGEYNWRVTSPIGMLVAIYIMQSHYALAIRLLREMKNIIKLSLNHSIDYYKVRLEFLIDIYIDQGEYSKAKRCCKKVKLIIQNIHRDIFGQKIAFIENTLGRIYIELKKFEKARLCAARAIEIYHSLQDIDKNKPKILFESNQNYIFSCIREGNLYLLQEEMDFEKAKACYQNTKLPQMPEDPGTHLFLVSWFYQNNNLTAAIEHCIILTRIQPYKASTFHNLGCFLHARAQIKLDSGNRKEYIEFFKQAECNFKKAQELDYQANICTEYALFLWRNCNDFDNTSKVIALAKWSIILGQKDCELEYNRLDRLTVDNNLQQMIDRYIKISIKAFFLAHYLLIQVYLKTSKREEAVIQLSLFENEVEKLADSEKSLVCELVEYSRDSINSEKSKRVHARFFQFDNRSCQTKPNLYQPIFAEEVCDSNGLVNRRQVNHVKVFGRHGLFVHVKKNSDEQEAIFEQAIPDNFSLSEAKGKGDCFYDSCAQELNEWVGKSEYTIKSLRLLCHQYAVELDGRCNANPQHPDNWIAKALNYDTRKYQDYLANVQYTVEERELGEGVGDDKLAVWGEQHIDGRILCKRLGVRLHVIEVRENPDDKTNEIQKFIVSHNLVSESELKNVNEDGIDWRKRELLHIAVCNLHFVPILRNATKQNRGSDYMPVRENGSHQWNVTNLGNAVGTSESVNALSELAERPSFQPSESLIILTASQQALEPPEKRMKF
ncbi:MAG: hypothetical protein K2X50_03885 [Gammaproteobacteria bacterium]|nr:hypothetical protein [Gammaproteobacteria bacterium]